MRNVIKLIFELAGLPIFFLAGFIPRSKRLWVFGAWHGKRYADNARFLFENVSDTVEDVNAVWISKNPDVVATIRAHGRTAYSIRTFRGAWIAARASAYFVTHGRGDISGVCSNGAWVAHLTHGTPIKRIINDKVSTRFGALTDIFDRTIRVLLPSYRPPSDILVASEFAKSRFRTAYGVSEERVIPTGYARWVPLHKPGVATSVRDLARRVEGASTVILYAPTQRRAGRHGLGISEIGGFEQLTEWLEHSDSLLLVRPHISLTLEDEADVLARGRGRILLVPSAEYSDVNEVMQVADVIVSDYSSVVFDFAVLKRPIIMLAHDLEDYKANDVGVYGDYERDFDGMIAKSWVEVIRLVQNRSDAIFLRAMERFQAAHLEFADGMECSRIVSLAIRKVSGDCRE